MYSVKAGSMLYRAAPRVETKPKPRYCQDTYKTGVYFSMNHPYLAETMCLEYKSDLTVAVYRVTKPFHVIIGKYSNPSGSHYDPEIEPVEEIRHVPVGSYYETNKCVNVQNYS